LSVLAYFDTIYAFEHVIAFMLTLGVVFDSCNKVHTVASSASAGIRNNELVFL